MKQHNLLYLLYGLFLLATSGQVQAQNTSRHTVSGSVSSGTERLIGVNILIKGSSNGTVTDIDGNYSLSTGSAADTLVFSYTGYAALEVPIAGRTQLNVNMEVAAELLEQVVVVGYGVQRKSDLTGSVATVTSESLNKIPTQSVGQALQGKVAGLQITPQSGAPGDDAIFRVRGTGTFRDANPLFVVDGMIVNDISFINPQDVDNVSVLKDASATAIYGSRGANGVIIVTTRKGSADRDGQIQLSTYTGVQEVIRKIDLANATEYATLANELSVNEGRPAPFPNPESYGEGTDWQDVIFRQAQTQNHQLSFTGGSERSTYNVSANYYRQEGIIRGSDFNRLSLRINNEYKIKPYLQLGHNVALIRSHNTLGPNVLLSALRSSPIVPVFDTLGNYGNTGDASSTPNVEAQIALNDNYDVNSRAVGNVYMNINFLKHFTFRSSAGLDFFLREGRSFVPVFFVSAIQQNPDNRLEVRYDRGRNWLWENTLSYDRSWSQWRINALAGVTAQDNFAEFLRASRLNFIDERDIFHYLSAGEQGTDAVANNAYDNWGIFSYLGRVNMSFRDRYLLTLSGRIDGSSRFGENNRYGYFPSFALGWNVSNEPFMADAPFSRLKLRLSWGQTGNDRIGDFDYTARVELGQGAVFGPDEFLNNGATLLQLANPNLRWETTTQTDLGVEMGFLDNRLLAEVDYYRRVADDILYAVPIPDYLGANAPSQNVASILNRGWDIKVDWQERTSDKFSYHFGTVISFIHNEVLAVSTQSIDLLGGGVGFSGILGTNSRAGYPVGGYFGYIADGIFQNEAELAQFPTLQGQQPGDIRFRDVNGDGSITPADRTLIGNPTPEMIYGINAGLSFGGIDFSVDFVGQAGYELINAKRASRFGLYNFEASYLDRWNGEGSSTTEPRVTTSGRNYDTFSTRFIEKGDFFRLRNIQLGYSLPDRLVKRMKLGQLRIYASGNNVLTWQSFSGYTPEIYNSSVFDVGIDLGKYPIAKTYLLGLDVQF